MSVIEQTEEVQKSVVPEELVFQSEDEFQQAMVVELDKSNSPDENLVEIKQNSPDQFTKFESVPHTIEKAQKKYRPDVTPYCIDKKKLETEDDQSCQVIDVKPMREKSTKEQSSFNTILSPKRVVQINRRESPQILRTAGKKIYNSMAPGARFT